MVFMPPGAAKSFYANVMFSAWYVGKYPSKKLITASYGQEVADKWGRRVRSIVKEPDYLDVFGTQLKQESQAAGRWELTNNSEYYAVGVGGATTSYRADLAIIDDPVKGREDADSETMRNKTREWYKSDLWTRLKPNAAIIIIMTRWNEDDLAGWLLEEMERGGEKWEVISLPMLAEENDPMGRAIGEPLWPEWFTDEMIEQARRDARTWSALYQQRPAPEEGSFFRKDWFKYYDKLPDNLRIYGASDYAVTSNGGDYTVHLVAGVDENDDIYVMDVWREQADSMTWVERFISLVKQHKPLEWAEENGQIIKSLAPLIDKRQREEKAFCYRKQFASTSDKSTRAQAIRGRMAMGKVKFPRYAPWLAEFESELLTFPAGKHDDQVDALSLLGRMLAEMIAAAPRPIKKEIKINTALPNLGQMTREFDERMQNEQGQAELS